MSSRTLKIIGSIVLALLVIAVIGRAVVFNSETIQNRLVERALDSQIGAGKTVFGTDKLEVVFCGTASPMGTGRAQQCIAVLAGDKFFIVDSGARSTDVATQLGLPVERLDGVLLTHFHSDHISSLGEMHLASWARGRQGQMKVYGGPGVDQVVDGFNMAYAQDYTYRTNHHGEEYVPSKYAGLSAIEVVAPKTGAKVIFDADGLTISVFEVSHPPIEPAYGYMFTYRGRSVVISGDTNKNQNLIDVAQGADVLIHEVLQPELVNMFAATLAKNGAADLGKILHDTLDYHTSSREVAESGNEAGVDLVVFTHYAPVPNNPVLTRFFLRGVDEVRSDGLLLAEDKTHIILPAPLNSVSDEIIIK